MKRYSQWVLAATLVVSSLYTLTSCSKAETKNESPEEEQVQSTELIRTSQSWDGVELPDYLQGRPELVAVKYVFPAGKKLGWHHHPVMNYGVLVQGELTIIGQDGKTKVVHEGDQGGCGSDHAGDHGNGIAPGGKESNDNIFHGGNATTPTEAMQA